MAKKTPEKPQIKFVLADPQSTSVEDLKKLENDTAGGAGKSSLVKSILNTLNGPQDSIERLAFEQDPSLNNQYQSIYYQKARLIPDEILKRITIQDDLVAAIVNARGNQVAMFGRPRPNRFEIGYVIEAKQGVLDKASPEQKKEIDRRIEELTELVRTCGYTKGWEDHERCTFSQYLYMSTRNAITVGRIATEVIHIVDGSGKRKFHSFRAIDGGTIYKAAPQKEAEDQVRATAKGLLEQMKNKKLKPEKFQNDEYAYVHRRPSRTGLHP